MHILKSGWRMRVAVFALVVSVATVSWFMLAALGTKWGWWSWQIGLTRMSVKIGTVLAMFAFGLGLLALTLAVLRFPRKKAFIVSLTATVLAAYCVGRLLSLVIQATALPPVHDIQTNWSDPVRYSSKIMAAREAQGETNPVFDSPVISVAASDRWPGMAGRRVADVQEEAETIKSGKKTIFPAIDSLYIDQSAIAIASLAEAMARQKGWEIVSPAPMDHSVDGAAIQIEFTATSNWFGFKDDIAIRIRPLQQGVRVDMRSTSRVGLSDLGANANRIHAFMTELNDRARGLPAP